MRSWGWQCGCRLAILVLCGGATGCEKAAEPGDTGLPEAELLWTLAPDQWQVFCKAVDSARRPPPEDECRRSAFAETRGVAASDGSDAEVRATCQTRYDACVREIRPPSSRGGICGFGPPGSDCTANVGEAEQCLAATIARRREEASKIPSCTTVTAAQARALAGTTGEAEPERLALPPCQSFEQKCPGLFR